MPSNATSTQQLAMRPVTSYTVIYRKEQHDQSLAHIPLLLTLQVEPNLKTFSRTLSPEALRYLHLGICIGKSHPHLQIFIMATATRQDNQGNAVHVGEEGAEGEGEYQDAKGRGAGDDREQGAPALCDP